MAKRDKKQENYLDYVFMRNPSYSWKEKEDGLILVTVEWKGFYSWVAQKFFKKPKHSEIAMDALGSFVWKQIDGQRNVHEISLLVKKEFGQAAEPVLERLIKFIEVMRDNKFIIQKEVKKHA